MDIAVPRETNRNEHRVGLTPWAVGQLARLGHSVVVEANAGRAARFPDREYELAGAKIVYSRDEAFMRADLICTVGLVPTADIERLKPGVTLAAFLHLVVAPRPSVARLRDLGVTAVGYELIEDALGRRPVLIPMSEMAGEMAVLAAAHYLQNREGGRGILLAMVPGIAPPTVLVLGAGTVGRSAAARALALGAHVIVLDEDIGKLREVNHQVGRQVVTQLATPDRLERFTEIADVVIGAVLIPGARAPFLVTEAMVRRMRPGSVIIDVSIDQGGCVETSRPTTLDDPVFVMHNVVHYCVPNMTANIARTASRAMSDALLAPITALAAKGAATALREDPGLAAGVYLYGGRVVHEQLARALGESPAPVASLVASDLKPAGGARAEGVRS